MSFHLHACTWPRFPLINLHKCHFVICFPMFSKVLLQVAGIVSFPLQLYKATKVSKSEGTRKVECAYNFWKCSDDVYQKLSKSVYACRNYSVPKLTHFCCVMLCKCGLCHHVVSVCLCVCVCPSRSYILSKWIDISSKFFHRQ